MSVERRIIERPRLIKLLDETDARTILLLAPAGYGKTTLARQWAKTLNGAIWVTLTPAHRDVAWLAEGIAHAIDASGDGAVRTIREHIRARTNPQRAARELGMALAEVIQATDVRWLIFDDYQELGSTPEAEDLLATLDRETGARTLITSRTRPAWASGRRFVYGEIFEVTRSELAMTESESVAVLGRRQSSAHLSAQAQGWPAVIGLAAAASHSVVPTGTVPQTLHRYLAEELFAEASAELQHALLEVALRGKRDGERSPTNGGAEADERIVVEAERLGFSSQAGGLELHPLLQEFLLEKLLALPDAEARVRAAVAANLDDGIWDHALALILHFQLFDLAEPALANSFQPLAREGRLATLEEYARAFQAAMKGGPPSASVVMAEVAFRDGNLELALDLAQAACLSLDKSHPAASRSAALTGQIAFLNADFLEADASFRQAWDYAIDERDQAEAAYGMASASIFGEQPGAEEAVAVLRGTRDRSPIDFLRFVSSEAALRLLGRTTDGLAGSLHLDAAREMLPHADDPRARTGLTYTIASALTQRADYSTAREWLAWFFSDAERYSLEFPLPYANWTLAQIAMGQRRFGEAERALQAVEDVAARRRERHHELNATVLRARLLLQTGETEAALRCLAKEPDAPLIPSWRAEHCATRALALACSGDAVGATRTANLAERKSSALEVRGLAQAARAIASLGHERRREREVSKLLTMAMQLEIWDPLVCAVRSAPALGDALANREEARPRLEALYQRTSDVALARRAGFRRRATDRPREILSPREYEILGLIARGYKNRDISKALFIADSTTKVHVRHILEKLGVRTRAEAAARLQMFDNRD